MELFSRGLSHKRGGSNPFFDVAALLIISYFIFVLSAEHREVTGNIDLLKSMPISLDYSNLPEYAMRTTLRMFAAMMFAVIFSVIYGYIAAKNKRMETILVPALDVLQSIPIFGYISFTVVGFLTLFPGRILGAECAVIFALFTSQAWNITFSAYQSFKNMPVEMLDAAKTYRMNLWTRFWLVELPFAIPGIIWNIIVSMSGGWFFIVASEVITVGDTSITLPGIGSYIALSLVMKDTYATLMAVLTMASTILMYDLLILAPLVAWADKFRYDTSSGLSTRPKSFVLDIFRRSRALHIITYPIGWLANQLVYLRLPSFLAFRAKSRKFVKVEKTSSKYTYYLVESIWLAALMTASYLCAKQIYNFIDASLTLKEVYHVMYLGCLTWLRVIILVSIASIIWVPIGVYIGLRPNLATYIQPLTQYLAAFPVNFLFPVFVISINSFHLDPNIWLTPLMIFGAQWYILFNVIGATLAVPTELKDAARNFRVSGFLWWKEFMIPAIAPFFITGAITASGGAWNASIVSEIISYGNQTITADGIGSYIAIMTTKGDLPRVALGISIMALIVVFFNKIFWQPIYNWSKKKFEI